MTHLAGLVNGRYQRLADRLDVRVPGPENHSPKAQDPQSVARFDPKPARPTSWFGSFGLPTPGPHNPGDV